MPLESAQYISDLQPDWPLGTDPESAGDDHIRQIKKATKNTFPNIDGPINGTPAQINDLTTHIGYTDASATDPSFPNYLTAHNEEWTASIPLIALLPSIAALNAHTEVVINWSAVQNILYPVGSVIINTGTNPNTLLGFGEWTSRPGWLVGGGLITDSAGLTETYGVGAVPGNFQVQQSQIAPFNQGVTLTMDAVPDHAHNVGSMGSLEGGGGQSINPFPNDPQYQSSLAGGHTPTGSGSATIGTGGAHFTPPSYAMYIWERTA